MASEHDDALGLDADRPLALRELADLSGLSEAELLELVDYGALAPAGETTGQWVFSVRSVTVARTARRLGVEFDLEPHGVALLLAYLDRVRDLEEQLGALKARLPR